MLTLYSVLGWKVPSICQAEEDTDKKGGYDVPVAKDHRRNGQIPVAQVDARGILKQQRIGDAHAANAGEPSGKHHREKACSSHVPARRIERMRVFP